MIAKLTIRNLRANMGRFAMTTFGVVLAVSFVVSAFVLGDGLRETFGSLTTEIVSGTDLEVRTIDEFGSTETLDDSDVAAVLDIDGVARAVGSTEAPENSVRPITASGEEIPTVGPPQLAFSWSDETGLSAFTLIEGASPDVGEFVMDFGSAERYDFVVGDTYAVVTSTGRHDLTLSGLTRFGDANQTLGAVLMGMNTTETDALFGTTGFDNIAIALTDAARVDTAAAQAAVAAALPGLEVRNQATVADETAADFNTQIDIIQSILLGFAGVSLLVSIFIIGNTFAIVLQQRTREMGLLRLIGADARQLRRGAMAEAGAIGALASIIGIPGGIGVATGLTALFGAIGADLPAYDIIVSTRTIAVALAVGVGATLIAAWWPTRVATSVAPMAALRTGESGRVESHRTRTLVGVAVGTVGAVMAGLGVVSTGSTTATLVLMAVGAVVLFVAITMVSPRLVAPVTIAFGTVLERLGMPARLAVRNARRKAGRTATTAAALMIGLAVVSMALVVGESVKSQLGDSVETAVSAEYLLTDQVADAGFPTTVVDELTADPTFDAVTGFRNSEMQIGDEVVEATAVRPRALGDLVDIGLTGGQISSGVNDAVVSADAAEAGGLSVGDVVAVTLNNGVDTNLAITGIFAEDVVVEQDWIVSSELFDQVGVMAPESWVAFNLAEGVDESTAAAAVENLQQRYPQGELETASEFRERMEGIIDQMLSVLNALVALAVIIALIGIANTLALSVSERTREIGLIRAVGMSRRGVRRMIRYESAMIAAFGALLGTAMGVGLGWLMVEALPSSFADSLAVPTGQIVTLVIVAAVAGLIAALLPARRAGRMNVLAAIAS